MLFLGDPQEGVGSCHFISKVRTPEQGCVLQMYVGVVGVTVTNPSQVKEERDRMKSEFESLSVTLRKVK